MWLATLLALAIIAFFIVKYVKRKSERKQADDTRLTNASAPRESLTQSAASPSITSADPGSPAAGTKPASAPSEHQGTGAVSPSASVSASAAAAGASVGVASLALDSGDTLTDVREMIKILNLAEPDASRLAISPEQLRALRNADHSAMPPEQTLTEVASKLRKMLA